MSNDVSAIDLSTWTPVQIDTELAALYEREYDLKMSQVRLVGDLEFRLHHAQGKDFNQRKEAYSPELVDQVCNSPQVPLWDRRAIRDLEARLLTLKAQVADLRDQMRPFHEQYDARRWSRAFLVVTNGQGHVHSSMDCSTCNKMGKATRFSWMPEWSGSEEAAIVEAAGERACTVCYPSAPVEVLSRPTKMFSAEEVSRQQARVEREAKAAARKAAEIQVMVFDGRRKQFIRVFKTERALTNFIAGLLANLAWYGDDHLSADQWLSDLQNCRMAVEAKQIAYDYDKALARARKNVVREGGSPRF